MIEGVTKKSFGGSSSGTYNVHALELATIRDRKLKGLNVTVRYVRFLFFIISSQSRTYLFINFKVKLKQ